MEQVHKLEKYKNSFSGKLRAKYCNGRYLLLFEKKLRQRCRTDQVSILASSGKIHV